MMLISVLTVPGGAGLGPRLSVRSVVNWRTANKLESSLPATLLVSSDWLKRTGLVLIRPDHINTTPSH